MDINLNSFDSFLLREDTANNSDKVVELFDETITVVTSVYAEFNTSPTAGDRQIELQFLDSENNVIQKCMPDIVQPASQGFNYSFSFTNPDLSSPRDSNNIFSFLPYVMLSNLSKVRVFDNVANDVSGDELILNISGFKWIDRRSDG